VNGECSIVRKVAEAQRQCLGPQVMLLAVMATIATQNNAKCRGRSMWENFINQMVYVFMMADSSSWLGFVRKQIKFELNVRIVRI